MMDNQCTYIVFSLPITAVTARELINVIVNKVPNGVKELHLLINSPGGSVPIALGIANFLEGLSCKLVTYNISRCDSAAIMVFAAGTERICLPDATFFSHSVQIELSGQFSLETLHLEYLKLKQEYKSILAYLSRKTLISSVLWKKYMTEVGHVFSSNEALRKGLATSINELRFSLLSKSQTIEVVQGPNFQQ